MKELKNFQIFNNNLYKIEYFTYFILNSTQFSINSKMIFVDLVFKNIASFLKDKDAVNFSQINNYTYKNLSKYVEINREMSFSDLVEYCGKYPFNFKYIESIEIYDNDTDTIINLPTTLIKLDIIMHSNDTLIIPKNIKTLNIGVYNKTPKIILPHGLTEINLHRDSLRKDTILPETLTSLQYDGNGFNYYPKSLTQLYIVGNGENSVEYIENLPDSILDLTITFQQIINLPPYLTSLRIENLYFGDFPILPDSITHFTLHDCDKFPILPKNCVQVTSKHDTKHEKYKYEYQLIRLGFKQYCSSEYRREYFKLENNLLSKIRYRCYSEGITLVLEDLKYYNHETLVELSKSLGIEYNDNINSLLNKLEKKIRCF